MTTPRDAAERARQIAERFVSESATLPLPEHGDDCLNAAEEAIVEELAGHIKAALDDAEREIAELKKRAEYAERFGEAMTAERDAVKADAERQIGVLVDRINALNRLGMMYRLGHGNRDRIMDDCDRTQAAIDADPDLARRVAGEQA